MSPQEITFQLSIHLQTGAEASTPSSTAEYFRMVERGEQNTCLGVTSPEFRVFPLKSPARVAE